MELGLSLSGIPEFKGSYNIEHCRRMIVVVAICISHDRGICTGAVSPLGMMSLVAVPSGCRTCKEVAIHYVVVGLAFCPPTATSIIIFVEASCAFSADDLIPQLGSIQDDLDHLSTSLDCWFSTGGRSLVICLTSHLSQTVPVATTAGPSYLITSQVVHL